MIFEACKLKIILEYIYHDIIDGPINLEISVKDVGHTLIAVNYGDKYYISYAINDMIIDFENFYVVLPPDALLKLHQMINLWPKSSIEILQKIDHVSMEIIKYGQLLRERPVVVECVFPLAVNDYAIYPPTMNYDCIINTRNLKQMLEFCIQSKSGINIEIRDKSIAISSSNLAIATMVELEELIQKPYESIKLSTEATQLIISFLNRMIVRHNLMYLLFITPENAISIHVKIDEINYVQIYVVHD